MRFPSELFPVSSAWVSGSSAEAISAPLAGLLGTAPIRRWYCSPFSTQTKADYDLDLSTRIAFGEVEALRDLPALGVLDALSHQVEHVLVGD